MPHNNDGKQLRFVPPARYASSRLPGKPLVGLAGLPMLVLVDLRVEMTLANVDIVVATDDQRWSSMSSCSS